MRVSSRQALVGMLTLGLGAAWGALALYVAHGALSTNAVDLPAETSVSAKLWSPQGWKFFTRNPREDWLLPFSRGADGRWSSASLGPNGRLDAYLGVDRRPRAQGIEIGLLLYRTPPAYWDRCTDAPTDCLTRSPIKATLRNRSPHPSLCGVVGFVLQEQLPWAWASSAAVSRMPSKVVTFEVQC